MSKNQKTGTIMRKYLIMLFALAFIGGTFAVTVSDAKAYPYFSGRGRPGYYDGHYGNNCCCGSYYPRHRNYPRYRTMPKHVNNHRHNQPRYNRNIRYIAR
jgi:hypothetical protein